MAVHVTVLVPTAKIEPLGGSHITAAPQLSVAVVTNSTPRSHRPGAVFAITFVEQTSRGFSRSCTVTVKLQFTLLLFASTAVQFTGVIPRANLFPDGGTQVTVVPVQVSDNVGTKAATASQRPDSVAITMFVGQVSAGGSLSRTVTVNEHVSVLPLRSVAVHVTVFTPVANRDPLGGAHAMVALPQLSFALAAKVATASQFPADVNSSCAAGQVIAGFSRSCTVTVKLHRFVLPLASVATQFTVVTPDVKAAPEGGVQTTVVPAQLSVTFMA